MANGQSGGSTELETGSIVNGAGGDADVLEGIAGGVATLRSFVAGTNITLTENAETIEIESTGGGGGLSQGAVNQLFASSPSQVCDAAAPVNAGSITCTVVEAAGVVTITCNADARDYVRIYSVVGTSAQSGDACLITAVSGDGLTLTGATAGGDNVLVTDAVASQLVVYGTPRIIGDPAIGDPSLEYSVNEGGDYVTVWLRKGFWTGPMFTAGNWFKPSGTSSGFMIGDGAVYKITNITANALVTSAL